MGTLFQQQRDVQKSRSSPTRFEHDDQSVGQTPPRGKYASPHDLSPVITRLQSQYCPEGSERQYAQSTHTSPFGNKIQRSTGAILPVERHKSSDNPVKQRKVDIDTMDRIEICNSAHNPRTRRVRKPDPNLATPAPANNTREFCRTLPYHDSIDLEPRSVNVGFRGHTSTLAGQRSRRSAKTVHADAHSRASRPTFSR